MVFRFFLLFLGSAFAVCVAVAGLMEESSNQFLVEWVGDSCSGSCGHSFFSCVVPPRASCQNALAKAGGCGWRPWSCFGHHVVAR